MSSQQSCRIFPREQDSWRGTAVPIPLPKGFLGCSDQQNEPRDSPLAGHWSSSPADRLRERRWHELRWDKMSEKLCRSSFGKLSVNPHQARKKKMHTGLSGVSALLVSFRNHLVSICSADSPRPLGALKSLRELLAFEQFFPMEQSGAHHALCKQVLVHVHVL